MDEGRFTLSTCDRCERLWRRHREHYAACNIVHQWRDEQTVKPLLDPTLVQWVAPTLSWHKSSKTPLGHHFKSLWCCYVAPQTVQDALVQIWDETLQDTWRHLIRSIHRHCQSRIQERGGHTNYSVLSCCNGISAKWKSLLHHFFTLIESSVG